MQYGNFTKINYKNVVTKGSESFDTEGGGGDVKYEEKQIKKMLKNVLTEKFDINQEKCQIVFTRYQI